MDLSKIECHILNTAGKKDFIWPLPQAEPAMDLISSPDKEVLVLDAGCGGLMWGSVAENKLWPQVRGWLGTRSE